MPGTGYAPAMERESDLHSARVDEQLKHEMGGMLQGRSFGEGREEHYTTESPDDPGLSRRPDLPSPGPGMPDQDEVELRSDLAASLRPSAFPADKATLVAIANEEGAHSRVLRLLDLAPDGQTFNDVAEVWEATGGTVEHRTPFGR